MNSVKLIDIAPDGIVSGVSDSTMDAIADSLGGTSEKRRASNVWPVHPAKRHAFRALRYLFGERGRVATWCRSWRGPWEVRFIETPDKVEFTHESRRACIEWEIAVLNQRLSIQALRVARAACIEWEIAVLKQRLSSN